MAKSDAPLLCLSGSGGGHVRQLLDIEAFWSRYPHFLVTEDTALGRSLKNRLDVEFVPHFALGQARLGQIWMMIWQTLRSTWISARVIFRRRPTAIISTGAGSQLFILAWGRLLGSTIILIDSFARVASPSKFAVFAGKLAHIRISQSATAGQHWKGSYVFDPLRIDLNPAPVVKEDLVFATVGAILPFDRLTKMVIEAKQQGLITDQIVLQTGKGGASLPQVEGIETVEELEFEVLKTLLSRARMVICHGGTGSLITALAAKCRVIAVPRRVAHGDAYDDHQSEIVELFSSRGLIAKANDMAELTEALKSVEAMPQCSAALDHSALMSFLEDQLI